MTAPLEDSQVEGGAEVDPKIVERIAEKLKNAHVSSAPMEALILAEKNGIVEQATAMARTEILRRLHSPSSNSLQEMEDIIRIADTFSIASSGLNEPQLHTLALALLSSVYDRSAHVLGAPVIIARFLRYMGGKFSSSEEVEALILAAAKNAQ